MLELLFLRGLGVGVGSLFNCLSISLFYLDIASMAVCPQYIVHALRICPNRFSLFV